MKISKVILLVEIFVKPEFLEELKILAQETLIQTLKETGCETFYQTSKEGEANSLLFFEVFTSKEMHDLHLEADYTKRFFAGVQGKLSGMPVTTNLSELYSL